MRLDDESGNTVRAGRLVHLLLLLQRRGRLTAAQLAEELEVSQRTVLRDIEALSGSGVPVYASRGPGGGFQLLEGYQSGLVTPERWVTPTDGLGLRHNGGPGFGRPRPGRPRRAAVRISPEGRRLAAVLGRLQPLRVRRAVPADDGGWLEATFRLETLEGEAIDVLSLGPQVEVLEPQELRREVADRAAATANLYSEGDRPPSAARPSVPRSNGSTR